MKSFFASCATVALLSNAAVAYEEKCTTKTVEYQEEVKIQDPAYANNDQWYMGFSGILNRQLDTRIRANGFGADIDPKEVGLGVAMSIGKEYGPKWRAEAELAYRRNKLESFTKVGGNAYNLVNDGVSSGRTDAWSLMGNIYRDFQVDEDMKAYLGAGVGLARIGYRNYITGGQKLVHDYDNAIAGQLIAGINKHLDENASLDVSYRYFHANRSQVDMPHGLVGDPMYRAHSIFATLRYTFGDRKVTPPARTVMEPRTREETECVQLPDPEPVVHTPDPFLVLFNHDSAELTAEAKMIIANAVEAYREFGLASIDVVGHTDRSGNTAYNDRLANRRAMAVKTELARLGISMSSIATEAKGESEPLVATGDGVREPQNRRAEIVLKK